MEKYIIEGNINFFDELYKSLDVEDNEQKTEEDNKLCLISNQPLTDKFIQMECGHKFNYMPLYLDVKNHKQCFNVLESTSCRLQANEIRCPYCRKKQTGLLPYYEELGLKQHGVNYIDPNVQSYVSSKNTKKCEYVYLNPDFIDSQPENNPDNEKYISCYMMGSPIMYSPGYGNEDTKCYCWDHKKIVIKKHMKEKNDKAKEERQKQKLQAKEEAKTKKEADKQKQLEEKQQQKQQDKEEKQKQKEEKKQQKEAKKLMSKNVILGPSIINVEDKSVSTGLSVSGCIAVLKSGPNKGNTCGFKIESDNMCKRHFLHYKKQDEKK